MTQNDENIAKGVPLFAQYNTANGDKSDAARNIALLRMENLVSPLANNSIAIQQALNQGMVATPLVSNVTASISPVWNVGATGQIPVVVSVQPRGYINAVVGTVTLNVA